MDPEHLNQEKARMTQDNTRMTQDKNNNSARKRMREFSRATQK